MSALALVDAKVSDGNGPRRERILTAAHACFVRSGFHRATMQDVAREAGMSPGNLYRTFASKEALVAGLCARDQADMERDFARLPPGIDILRTLDVMFRKHLVDNPRERYIVILDIWAESARNPELARHQRQIEQNIRALFVETMMHSLGANAASEHFEVNFAAGVMQTLIFGLFRRRALEADFDGEAGMAMALGVMKCLLAGAIRPQNICLGAM